MASHTFTYSSVVAPSSSLNMIFLLQLFAVWLIFPSVSQMVPSLEKQAQRDDNHMPSGEQATRTVYILLWLLELFGLFAWHWSNWIELWIVWVSHVHALDKNSDVDNDWQHQHQQRQQPHSQLSVRGKKNEIAIVLFSCYFVVN